MKRIAVIGGGFAGLWSAVGAARKLDELGVGPADVEITLINRDAYHGVRVRFYEADLSGVRVPLDQVLEPIGVRLLQASVRAFDFDRRQIVLDRDGETTRLDYDRFVLASGSRLYRPPIPGLEPNAFSVDSFAEASKLADHLATLPAQSTKPGWATVVVVGAGLTGIETACEMPARLRSILGQVSQSEPARVILVDHSPHVGSNMGASAQPVIEEALESLRIETRTGVRVAAIDAEGISLDTGERIETSTTIWTAGMRASPLTELFPAERDHLGRLPVDEFLKIRGMNDVFAAGDVAWFMVDGEHASVMSCQHGRPMGRFAGHNVVCDLLGLPMLPLRIEDYVTVLDLGPWGAVYTQGWDRVVALSGAKAKTIKQQINCQRIYPPTNGDRRAILDAAKPTVQPPPRLNV